MRPPRSALLLLSLSPLACASWDTGTAARARAAAVLECPEAEVTVTAVAAHRYRGEGCGAAVTVACTAAALEPTCLPERAAGGEEGAAEPGPEPPPAVAEADVEALVRSRLDGRAADILACAGRERVAVRVTYQPDGVVRLQLQGALRDTAEERCVQDVLQGARLPPPGREGAVVHLVRALAP